MAVNLLYSSCGVRDYRHKPVPRFPRHVWEIQYVHGAAEPSFLIGGLGSGVRYRLGEDCDHTLWIFTPGLAHGWTSGTSEMSRIIVFHFDVLPAEILAHFDSSAWIAVSWKSDSFLDRAIQWLNDEARELSFPISTKMRGNDGSRIPAIQSIVLAMVDRVTFQATDGGASSQNRFTRLDRAISWFEANMHASVRTEEVARAGGTSVRHLSRLSLNRHGISFGQLLHQHRMARALLILKSEDLSISEIARICGYRNTSSFSRAVHRHFGETPCAVRNGAARDGR